MNLPSNPKDGTVIRIELTDKARELIVQDGSRSWPVYLNRPIFLEARDGFWKRIGFWRRLWMRTTQRGGNHNV